MTLAKEAHLAAATDTPVKRIQKAVDVATAGHRRFSCWSGPSGSGVVEITHDDLRAVLARITKLEIALQEVIDQKEYSWDGGTAAGRLAYVVGVASDAVGDV